VRSAFLMLLLILFQPFKGIGADRYLPAESDPKLEIKGIAVPKDRSQPLDVTFELAAQGRRNGPVAISQQQLSLHISTKDEPYLFVSDLQFPKSTPSVFVVEPGKPTKLSAKSSSDRFHDNRPWSALPPGKYRVRVYINSGKSLEFDYQWLGSTYSADFELTVE